MDRAPSSRTFEVSAFSPGSANSSYCCMDNISPLAQVSSTTITSAPSSTAASTKDIEKSSAADMRLWMNVGSTMRSIIVSLSPRSMQAKVKGAVTAHSTGTRPPLNLRTASRTTGERPSLRGSGTCATSSFSWSARGCQLT